MIDLSILPLFITAIFFLAISPGPDLVLISSYSSTKGFKAGVMVSLGIFSAGIIQTLLVGFGLGKLMQSVPIFAYLIKVVGALYLSYLGIKMLISWYRINTHSGQNKTNDSLSMNSLIYKGLFNNLLNPKALLFFSLFLPQFTNNASPLTAQILILGIILSSFTLIINCTFSIMFSQASKLAGSKFKLGRHADGLLGVIFLGLATRLVTDR